jgi:tetrahydromethanopterin S-methyltransferase subunit H
VEIGGQPGELGTTLIGSIFYERDKTVEDSAKGTFDKKRAKELIEKQSALSEKTGNPHM